MGRRKLEEVRRWAETHPPPPADAPLEVKKAYARTAPTVRELESLVASMIVAAEKANLSVPVLAPDGTVYALTDPGPTSLSRPCAICGHPGGDHRRESPCECCRKGLKIIPGGTNMFDLALKEQGQRRR